MPLEYGINGKYIVSFHQLQRGLQKYMGSITGYLTQLFTMETRVSFAAYTFCHPLMPSNIITLLLVHAFQEQQLQSLHPQTPQCKRQLQASRVTSSNRQQCPQGPVCVHKSCSIARNVKTKLTHQLQSGRVPGQGAPSIASCPVSSVLPVYEL